MEPGFKHIVRWRAHEFTLVTILVLLSIAGYIRPVFELSGNQLAVLWGDPFLKQLLSFNYYRNVLFPHVGFLLLLYGCYCWMTCYIIPYLMQGFPSVFRPGIPIQIGEPLGKILWSFFNLLLLITVLGIGWGIAYSYLDAPTVVDKEMTNPMIVGIGLLHTAGWVVGYVIYAVLREVLIRAMQSEPIRNAHRITIVNQLTGYCMLYYSLGSLVMNFNLMGENEAFTFFYFVLLPPVILTIYTLLYWVLPVKREGTLWRGWRGRPWRRLLAATGCIPIPFLFYGIPESRAVIPVSISFWLLQLVITTPVSWLIYRQWKDKIFQMQGLQTALGQSEADLQFLRSQINPHFLFNILNTLYGTALQEKAGRTAEGVQKLGDMMRFMLHENHLAEIPMTKEIEYLRNYIALQELRTESGESIRIETVIDETFPEYKIAPMLLIPFVENGFKHGISLREPSWIKVRLLHQASGLLFEVRNSIHTRKGDDPEKARSGIGLKNVLHRLKLLYPNKHEFYMHQDEKEFFVQVAIQL